jgi:hypothetical protein
MSEIHYGAVFVAALSSFFLGGLWYSPALFGKLWNREMGRGMDYAMPHPARVFGVSFVLALVAAAAFALLLGPKPELGRALCMGLVIGVGLVGTSFGINYQFAEKSALTWLIDGGYHVAQFVLFGLVLGLWH